MSLSSDPRDTVREYAPDAVRRTAYALANGAADERGYRRACSVGWRVTPDGEAFVVEISKHGSVLETHTVNREGEVLS
jgi:hypothetical protein